MDQKTKQNEQNKQSTLDQIPKKNEFLSGIIALVIAFFIMLVMLGTAFYFIIHYNINGLGERFRPNIQKIPILKLALPTVPDPDDPKYLTPEEITKRYDQLRKLKIKNQEEIDLLIKQLEQNNQQMKKITEEMEVLRKEDETLKANIELQKQTLIQSQNKVTEDRKKLDEIAANGNKEAYKAFYEKINPEIANKIYKEIVKEDVASEELIKTAKILESMDSKAAADIIKGLYDSNRDFAVSLLKNSKKETVSSILAALDPQIASNLTQRLAAK